MDTANSETSDYAPWEMTAAKIGKTVAAILAVSVIGAVAIFPGWLAHNWLWDRLPWPTNNRRMRIAFWVTAIPLYCASAYLMCVYVFPLLSSKYESPYEDSPCPQGGGWGC